MGTWVLVLAMYNGGMTNIPGFTSGSTCAEAGKVWLNKKSMYNHAVCIQVK